MPKPQKILLADNIDSYRQTCEEFLQLRGYQVTGVNSPEACLRAVETDLPHLVILDLRMRDDTDERDDSGLKLAKQLPPRLPKIILTAFPTWELTRAVLTTTEEGLSPATFFVSKLEGLEVLYGYVQRAFAEHGSGLVLDLANQSVWVDGKEQKLTSQPFKLLCFLYEYACKHPNQVCTRRDIIEDFFGQEYDEMDIRGQEGLVDTNIHRIRTALKDLAPERDYLVTVRGQGFRLVLDE